MAASKANHSMTVGDLFCGAGGFAEGFRQAGFDVRWAIDNWPPAAETFRRNFPSSATVLPKDVMTIDARELERVDVVIGSPPCTYFSMANRGGSGDKEQGLRLVKRYFEIVKDLRPKYWIMENVPPLRSALERELDGEIVSLANGSLAVPTMKVLVASAYGAPQARRRLFSGNYPVPRPLSENGSTAMTLKSILGSLPDPCPRLPSPGHTYKDPLYPQVEGPQSALTDHFEDDRFVLTREELRECKSLRQEHRYGGRMDWPDSLDRPSRTITATRTKASRSTIVIRCPHHATTRGPLRGLTLRECASVQGFPTTFQFWADSLTAKDRLIGNAVSPILARALAHEILREEGMSIPRVPCLEAPAAVPPPVTKARRRLYRYRAARRFRRFVRIDWKRDCRVELENLFVRHPGSPANLIEPSTRWVTRLYLGYAKQYRCYELSSDQIGALVAKAASLDSDGMRIGASMDKLRRVAYRAFERLPEADSLQQRWSGRKATGLSPDDLVAEVGQLVDTQFDRSRWRGVSVPKESISKILGLPVSRGRDADASPPMDLPIRTLASAMVLALACNALNSEPEGGLVQELVQR